MNKNSKVLALKTPDKVAAIIKKYGEDKQHDKDFIFPELKKANLEDAYGIRVKTKNGNRNINKRIW